MVSMELPEDESGRDLEWHHHRQLIRRGTFSSVKAVNNAIKRFTADWNADARPLKWAATADEIIDKVRAVTRRIAKLLGATEIGHVVGRAA
jgi:hypothetical protein